jgi:hypothetical protein
MTVGPSAESMTIRAASWVDLHGTGGAGQPGHLGLPADGPPVAGRDVLDDVVDEHHRGPGRIGGPARHHLAPHGQVVVVGRRQRENRQGLGHRVDDGQCVAHGQHRLPRGQLLRRRVRRDLRAHVVEVVQDRLRVRAALLQAGHHRRLVRLEVEVEHRLAAVDPHCRLGLHEQRLRRFRFTVQAVRQAPVEQALPVGALQQGRPFSAACRCGIFRVEHRYSAKGLRIYGGQPRNRRGACGPHPDGRALLCADQPARLDGRRCPADGLAHQG